MRMIFFIIVLIFAWPAQAQVRGLQLELAEERVDITTGFNGTNIVLFGTSEEPEPDIVVTLKGPEHTTVVRKKDHMFGAWMNRHSVEFRRVPSYYDYASSMTQGEMDTMPDILAQAQVGVDHLGFYPEDGDEDAGVADTYGDALIRTMQRKGFYPIKPVVPEFMNPRFFKISFELPPGVPTGLYKIEASLIKDGKIVTTEAQTLQVGQVGFNARVYLFANQHSLFYGLFAVVMALASGWAAFTFLRRD